jgi:hypothetical protein
VASLTSAQPAYLGSSFKGTKLNGVLSSAYKSAAGEVSSQHIAKGENLPTLDNVFFFFIISAMNKSQLNIIGPIELSHRG